MSCMLHEPIMARPCMEGYQYVGRPASSKERRQVTKCRQNFSSTWLKSASFFSLSVFLLFYLSLSVGKRQWPISKRSNFPLFPLNQSRRPFPLFKRSPNDPFFLNSFLPCSLLFLLRGTPPKLDQTLLFLLLVSGSLFSVCQPQLTLSRAPL